MALAETRLVNETRNFLERNGVVLDSFSRPDVQRSDTVIIAKNLPAGIDDADLKQRFEKYGEVKRFLLPPGKLLISNDYLFSFLECKVTALIEMKNRVDAKKAFTGLAYSRVKSQPLYLEWAPVNVFEEGFEPIEVKTEEEGAEPSEGVKIEENGEEKEECSKILVRNIPFQVSLFFFDSTISRLFSGNSKGSAFNFCYVWRANNCSFAQKSWRPIWSPRFWIC